MTADSKRIDAARHDRLQRRNQLRADQDGIDAFVRLRGVAAAPLDPDDDGIASGHDRAGPKRECADRDARTVMHAVDLLDAEPVHQPVLDHRDRAGAALFRRLEDHDRVACEIAGLGKIARRTQKHRGVAVMAAGVHQALCPGGVGQIGRLLDRQRVHVRPQPDDPHVAPADGLAALDDADDAGAADTGDNLVAAEFPQPVRHQCRSAVHVVEQLRMLMNIPAPGLDVGLKLGDAVDDGHGDDRLSGFERFCPCSMQGAVQSRPAAIPGLVPAIHV